MAGEQHAASFGFQVAHEGAQAARGHHVEAVGGFVEDHVFRIVHQRARDRGLDALALREPLGAAVEDVAHLQRIHQFFAALVHQAGFDAVQAREIVDVLARAQALVQAARIRQDAEASAHRDRIDRRIDAVHQHLPGVGFHQGVQHPQGGGLAGAVGAEQPGDLAVAGGEADAVDGFHLAEGLVQVPDLDHDSDLAWIGPLGSRGRTAFPASGRGLWVRARFRGAAVSSITATHH